MAIARVIHACPRLMAHSVFLFPAGSRIRFGEMQAGTGFDSGGLVHPLGRELPVVRALHRGNAMFGTDWHV